MGNRVCFLVDGFNVYHSVCAAQKATSGASLKWLDIRSLCSSYLASIGNGASLERVFYFSAFMDWIPDKVARHEVFVEALRVTGVEVRLGRLKGKQVWCKTCKQLNTHHEEKETDVAIAVKMMELLHLDACDTVVLVSGDTDLAPAIRTSKALWPEKRIWALFPFARHNAELKAICHGHLKVKAERYGAHQLPNPVKAPSGALLKPASW